MQNIKTAEEIAKRIFALQALLARSDFEGIIHMSQDKLEIQKSVLEANQLTSAINSADLQKYLSPKEKEEIAMSAGAWNQKIFINATWRIESLGVILWAAGILDKIPNYDNQVDRGIIENLLKPLEFNSSDINISAIHIRPVDEILRQQEIAGLWHWRSRTSQMIREKLIPENYDEAKLLEICKMVAQKSFEAGQIPQPINDDFPAFQKAYKNLTDEEYNTCTSIAMERHFGLNWLCGYGDGWDNTPTET